MSLDLTPGSGNLLGEFYWELISPWRGASSTLNTGASPRDAVVSSLSLILQADPPPRYYLTKTACRGILRRAAERGKELPFQLKIALLMQAGLIPRKELNIPTGDAYHINQRNEGIDLGGVSGALMHTQNMQMQTFVTQPTKPAAFAANQRDEVRDLHDIAGALGAQPGMKQQPLVLASQQGGAEIGEGVCPTITSAAGTSGNNQPVLYENHGIDARYTGPHPVAPTMSARYGTGGNNVPLVGQQEPETYCIVGNVIDRQPENGGNGKGYQADLAYTLTATDKHAVFCRQRVDEFKGGDTASCESARQYKDATDLVMQETVGALTSSDYKGPNNQYVSQDKCIVEEVQLIRRLTPLECERLQGFPDGWTDIPGASDAARYKALGNSVAIPCVEYIMRGIALAMGAA